jgi:hypothetical protein
MATAIRRTVIVQPGGKIELTSLGLTPGIHAEVIVIADDDRGVPRRPLASFVGARKGRFRTADEVDDFIRRERDSWE